MLSRQDRTAFYLVLALPFVAVILKTAWLSDDAFITFRTIDHLLSGFGPVWNVGERVQTYTHPLWMLLLAAAIFVTDEFFYTSLALSLVLSLAAYLLLVRFVALTQTGMLLGALILILSKAFIDYATSGLENPLTYLLLALFFACYFSARPTLWNLFWLAFLAALGAVNRLDTLLLFGPPLFYAAWRLRSAGIRPILALLAGFAPLLLWELFSLIYYGFPFPNTAYAKISTGLPVVDVTTQGMLYLVNTAGSDLLTLVVLLAGMMLPLITRRKTEVAVAAGIALYLLYVIWIGGDFMMGRFLSAPLLCAVVPIMRYPYADQNWRQAGLLLLGVLLLGLANPSQSPLFADANYDIGRIDNKGIADERGHYYQRYGLLSANRLNRLVEQGRVEGVAEPRIYSHCGIGLRGFSASPYTHIIDFCGLADPLLARLPAVHDPDWRVGHPIRTIPVGYLGTIRTGRNHLTDPQLAAYYDALQLITRGALFDPDRLREIWRMNSGQSAHLIEEDRYRYPGTVRADLAGLQRYWADIAAEGNGGIEFGAQGIRVEMGERIHANLLDLGTDLDHFDVIYYEEDEEIGRQRVNTSPLQLGGEPFTIVQTPAAIADAGYAALMILPARGGQRQLRHLQAIDDRVAPGDDSPSADLSSLLRRYYHAYYRAELGERAAQLDRLADRIAQADPSAWTSLADAVIIDLLEMPIPALHSTLDERLSFATFMAEDGTPHLRYLGSSAALTPPDAPDQGLQLALVFEVLEPFSEAYTVWFHIVAESEKGESDEGESDQYMIYDYAPMETTLNWSPGAVVRFRPVLKLAPGRYEVSAGFWTPGDRRRLYLEDGETYWLNFGTLTVEETAPSAE